MQMIELGGMFLVIGRLEGNFKADCSTLKKAKYFKADCPILKKRYKWTKKKAMGHHM